MVAVHVLYIATVLWTYNTVFIRQVVEVYAKRKCRAASKSPHQKFGYFLSMSQQVLVVSADITKK